jgi:hypothetical protein
MTKNGPIPVRVNTVTKTTAIDMLHERIAKMLESMGVRYSAPQYIHSGYVPHVTHQEGSRLNENDTITATVLYLVEASAPEYGNERKVIQRFSLLGSRK